MTDKISKDAMNKLSYGMFVLSARYQMKDNACIINTAMQITDEPKRITIAVNKNNLTCEMVDKSGKLNISILNDKASFELIKRFGFVSGREVDKFSGFDGWERADNDIVYITESTNAYISAVVVERIDVGTHIMFVCEVTEGVLLNTEPSLTYEQYHSSVKPNVKNEIEGKTVYVCSVCGYEYEGEELPSDFVCPWCKHTAEAFEKIKK